MITAVGAVVILLGFLFFLNDTALLYLFVFFTPFTAASIVSLPGSAFGFQPAYYLGLLLVVKLLIRTTRGKLILWPRQKLFLGLIAAFWVFALATLLLPLLWQQLNVSPLLINPLLIEPTNLNGLPSYALNSFFYFTFFLLIAVAVMSEIGDWQRLIGSLKVFIASAVFSVVWELVQYASMILKFDYPYWLFNNHAGYGQSWGGAAGGSLSWDRGAFLPRLSSIAPEPSMYGFFLVAAISLLLVLNANRIYLFSRRFQIFAFLFLIFGSLLSTSSTAYLGIVIMLAGAALIYFQPARLAKFIIDRRYLFIAAVLVLMGVVGVAGMMLTLYYFRMDISQFLNIINSLTLSKFAPVSSGAERSSYLRQGLDVFTGTYLLGSGWGMNRTTDFIATMLANVGLAGLLLYALAFLPPALTAFRYYRARKRSRSIPAQLSLALAFAFLIMVVMMVVSIPDFIYMYFWYLFGLLLALPALQGKPEQEELHADRG